VPVIYITGNDNLTVREAARPQGASHSSPSHSQFTS
jgi:hypothetical protein